MPAVLLNSGGLDSAIVAAAHPGCHSLHLAIPRPNAAAIAAAAAETARRYCSGHTVIPLGIPTGERMNMTAVCLALAQSFARVMGYDAVYAGTKGTVQPDYADAWNALMRLNTRSEDNPPVVLPLVGRPVYYDALAESFGLDVGEFGYTHSCMSDPPCGECWKCRERERAGV